jgi:hypothetical protein
MSGYYYCAVFPGALPDLWPHGIGADVAVPMEVDPAWWKFKSSDAPWLRPPNEEHEWPSDVARNCSRVGYEVSFSSGVPLIGRDILRENNAYFWEHLTLGLLSDPSEIGDVQAWTWLRQETLMSLLPDSWLAPPSCNAILHVSGEDRLFILTRAKELLEKWIAGHLVSHFELSEAPRTDAVPKDIMREITRWLVEEANVSGAQVSRLALVPHGSFITASISGRWGRGSDSGLRAGEPLRERFRKEWRFPTVQ